MTIYKHNKQEKNPPFFLLFFTSEYLVSLTTIDDATSVTGPAPPILSSSTAITSFDSFRTF
jgi:hypothetical protein